MKEFYLYYDCEETGVSGALWMHFTRETPLPRIIGYMLSWESVNPTTTFTLVEV